MRLLSCCYFDHIESVRLSDTTRGLYSLLRQPDPKIRILVVLTRRLLELLEVVSQDFVIVMTEIETKTEFQLNQESCLESEGERSS